MGNGEENALAHGRAWIEAETGVVHKTELVIGDADSDIRVVTWYRLDLGLIRFGGHLPRGGYDVDHGRPESETDPAQLHRGI